MSTYYYFHCNKHQVSGGCWTRQMWGCGNADLIDTFKFVMYHALECGADNIGMHSEHDDDGYVNTSFKEGPRRQHLEQTRHIFPHSDDWKFVAEQEGDWNEAWIANELKQLGGDD